MKCQGQLRDGRVCNVVLAARVAGRLVIKRAGFEAIVGEVYSLTCDRCKSVTEIPPQKILQPREEAAS